MPNADINTLLTLQPLITNLPKLQSELAGITYNKTLKPHVFRTTLKSLFKASDSYGKINLFDALIQSDNGYGLKTTKIGRLAIQQMARVVLQINHASDQLKDQAKRIIVQYGSEESLVLPPANAA